MKPARRNHAGLIVPPHGENIGGTWSFWSPAPLGVLGFENRVPMCCAHSGVIQPMLSAEQTPPPLGNISGLSSRLCVSWHFRPLQRLWTRLSDRPAPAARKDLADHSRIPS